MGRGTFPGGVRRTVEHEAKQVTLDPLPDLGPVLQAFHSLATSSLRSGDLKDAAAAHGWQEDRSYLPEQIRFAAPGCDLPIFVGVSEDAVHWATQTLSYWEPYSPADYPDMASFLEARRAFDALYAAAAGEGQAQFGPPWRTGADPGEQFAHKHSIWRFPLALLIIQQAALDLQFGVEVNLWLARYTEEPHPTSPLIDWLTGMASSRSGVAG
jgi:hypothetical protein